MKIEGCCGSETKDIKSKISGMMGGCMPSGCSDPMEMCNSMMGAVVTSAQMAGYATPEVRALFDEWASELANEILQGIQGKGQVEPENIARQFKISEDAALYFITRLIRDKKVRVTGMEVVTLK